MLGNGCSGGNGEVGSAKEYICMGINFSLKGLSNAIGRTWQACHVIHGCPECFLSIYASP